jgi:hypothetical protein
MDKRNQSVKLNKQITIFLVCIFISTISWLLITLSADNYTFIEIPVLYEDLNQSKTVINKLPSKLKLKILTSEFKILMKKYFWANDTVKISYNILNNEYKGNRTFMLSRDILTDVAKQLKPNIEILSIMPDTIHFYFDKKINKKVPVRLVSELIYEKQFQLVEDIKIKPDSIIISGAQILIDKVSFIETYPLIIKNIRNDLSMDITLNKFSISDSFRMESYDTAKIDISSSNVKVFINVEKFTESVIDVNVIPLGFPEGRTAGISPKKVKVKYQVSFLNYNKVKPEMFSAAIYFDQLKENRSGKAQVTLIKKPDFIIVSKIDPEKVDYIIRK